MKYILKDVYSTIMKSNNLNHITLNSDEFQIATNSTVIDIVTFINVCDYSIVIIKLLNDEITFCWNLSNATTYKILIGQNESLDE
jgi:hypothetical protein